MVITLIFHVTPHKNPHRQMSLTNPPTSTTLDKFMKMNIVKIIAIINQPAWRNHSNVQPACKVIARMSSSLGPSQVIVQAGMVSQSSSIPSLHDSYRGGSRGKGRGAERNGTVEHDRVLGSVCKRFLPMRPAVKKLVLFGLRLKSYFGQGDCQKE